MLAKEIRRSVDFNSILKTFTLNLYTTYQYQYVIIVKSIKKYIFIVCQNLFIDTVSIQII